MIEERIDELIRTYENYIFASNRIADKNKEILIEKLKRGGYEYVKPNAEKIEQCVREIGLFRVFIESLKYAKTGERK